MPTYQYACTVCGHRFEAVQSFSDSSLTDCPVCTGRLRKVFSSVGIVFKGSGFYRTDSRTGTGTDSGKEKVTADSSTSGSSDTKSDSTSGSKPAGSPATKSDSKPSTVSSTSSTPAAASA